MTKQSATRPNQVTQAWRIFQFRERFELPVDVRIARKSGLRYVRDFVGVAGGSEAIRYQRQLAALMDGNGLEFYCLYGAYRQLINLAAKWTTPYRGHLLHANTNPLTDAQIGQLLKISHQKMSRILRRLASVKLIEKVAWPREQ